jgi:hypothetical protein
VRRKDVRRGTRKFVALERIEQDSYQRSRYSNNRFSRMPFTGIVGPPRRTSDGMPHIGKEQ